MAVELAKRDLAEWLGVEVVEGKDPTGRPQLRWRVTGVTGKNGTWSSCDASATDVKLWDSVRALVKMYDGQERTMRDIEDQVAALRQELLAERSMPRLTPKGGDRNEFARQVRRLARHAVAERDDAAEVAGADSFAYALRAGALDMANRVLVMLGEQPMLDGGRFPEVVERQELVDALVRMRSGVSKWGQVLPDPSSTAARVEAATRDTAVATLDVVLRLLSGEVYIDHRGNVMEPVAGEETP
jgi:hypothetical protein